MVFESLSWVKLIKIVVPSNFKGTKAGILTLSKELNRLDGT
jgi:hypothetical protein